MVRTKNIFILAILVRLILLPFLYHPDLKSQYFQAQFLAKGHLNIFSFLHQNSDSLPYQDSFNYTPPIYLIQGLYLALVYPIAPTNLNHWLNDWGLNQYAYANLPWFLALLKIPYLFLDLLLGYLIFKRYGIQIATFWLFNPLCLYALYFHSNFDIIPTFLVFLSFILLSKSRGVGESAFCFATAISLKLFPLFLIPLLFVYPKKIQVKFYFFLSLFLASYLLFFQFFFPGWLSSLTSSGLLQKTLEVKLFFLPLFPSIYLAIVSLLFLKKISISFFLILLSASFWTFVPLHGQWLIWFLPFLITDPKISKSKPIALYLSLISFFTVLKIFLLNDSFMTFGHLVPINTSFLIQTTPYEYLLSRFSHTQLNNLFMSIQILLLFFTIVHANKDSG